MKKNTMKAKLAAGKAVVGFVLMYEWPEMVQIAGHLGVDYVMLDGEHGYLGIPEMARLIRAAESVDVTPIARVPRNAPDVILSFLDAGAQGIIIPNVNTREEAAQAVMAVKYFPEGQRGTGYGHSMEWQLKQPFSEYVKEANRETMVLPQCESKEGLQNLAEIVKVPGVDAIWMGPNDLAQSLGHPGLMDHPEVKESLARAKDIVLASGKYLGVGSLDGDTARKAIAAGARIICLGCHRLFISAAREYLTKARAGA